MSMTNLQLMRAIAPQMSAEFQKRIPEITQTNMEQIANTFDQYPTIANEFVNVLTNQVIRTMFMTRALDNPLSMFEKGDLSKFGKSLELIYVDIITGKDFTDRFGGGSYEGEVLRPEAVNNVKVQYLTENSRLKYKVTISNDMLASAFKSESGLSTLVNQLVSKMVESYNVDKFLMTWKLIETMNTVQFQSTKPVRGDKASCKKFAIDIKKTIKDMRFPSDKYNSSHVWTKSLPKDLFIIVDTETSSLLDVELLADTFNMSKVEFESRIVEVPTFGREQTIAYIVDRDKLQIYSTKYASDSVRNGAGLFTNVFLHRWDLFGACDFANCVELTTTGAYDRKSTPLTKAMPFDIIKYDATDSEGTVLADLKETELEIGSNGEIKTKKEKKVKPAK